MKSELYSWGLSAGLKAELENAARRRRVRLAAVLEMAAREWLSKNSRDVADDEEQKRLHAATDKFIGAFSSGNGNASRNVRKLVRERLARKYGRR